MPDSGPALLGCILAGADPTTIAGITAASFYQPRDGHVWTACIELAAQGIRPDPTAVSTRLDGIVDPMHVIDLYGKASVASNAGYYAKELRDQAARRRLADIAAYIGQNSADEVVPVDHLIEEARARLDGLDTGTRKAAHSLGELYPAIVERIKSGGYQGDASPWTDLDRHIGGFQPSRLYVIAARPGVGKSMMAQNIAQHVTAKHGKRTYFSTLEMPADELGLRFLSAAIGVDNRRLQEGSLSADEWHRLDDAGKRGFVDYQVDICDSPTQTIESIRTGARDTARKGELGLIVVDYLQLMEGAKRDTNRAEVVAGFSRGLKMLAKEFRVPVIALSQLNRNAVGQEPKVSDLRESGAIEQDADVILLLDQDPKDRSEMTVIVGKNRSGSLGEFKLTVKGWLSKIQTPRESQPYA